MVDQGLDGEPVDGRIGYAVRQRASAPRSCRRDVIPSFENVLRRCHSTVRGLMNIWAAISGLVIPSRASPAICASCCGEVVEGVRAALADRLAGGEQLVPSPLSEGFEAHPVQLLVCGPELFAGIDATAFAPQPLAVLEVGAGELDAEVRPAEVLDRLERTRARPR